MVRVFFTVSAVFHEMDFFRRVDFISHGDVIGCFTHRADQTNE